ncbi:MAG: FGGY-family carbohydrate kinase [Firmicutes bacterium]|nr:FGGY-family carbohydrate kinase [Bacillota bacterium]
MYVISYDIGTTGLKTCLFDIDKGEPIKLVAGEEESYDLYVLDNGGVEQDPLQWWAAMCMTTRRLLASRGIPAEDIKGISFCAQMQAVVLVDDKCNPVRNAMSYMDNRGGEQIDKGLHSGVKVMGMNADILQKSIRYTGAVSCSVKDPIWRYRWVADNEPEIFAKVYKWLDAKDFLTAKATGRFTMSRDSAFGTLLYDTREGQNCFNAELCDIFEVDLKHLPEIVLSTDVVGGLTSEAADALGIVAGTPVFSGGGDASLIGVGAGAVAPGDTHMYLGTSGWVGTVTTKQKLGPTTSIASIVGVDPDAFNCFAELETAGKCFEWARNNLFGGALSFEELGRRIEEVPAGSNGLIFAPWIHGNRCPFEDPNSRGVFVGIGLDTDAAQMYRAVVEGVCLHLRWQMSCMNKLVRTSKVLRLAGGGARTAAIAQILADITGKTIEVVESPQNAGSTGAAALMAVGLGLIDSVRDIKSMIRVEHCFKPNVENKKIYDKEFAIFKDLYKTNRKTFAKLAELR